MEWKNAVPGWTFTGQTVDTEAGEAGLFVRMDGNFQADRDTVMYYGLFLGSGKVASDPRGYKFSLPSVRGDGSLVI